MNFLARIFGNSGAAADQPRGRGRPRGRNAQTARRDAEIKAAYESGISVEGIAAQFGMYRTTVYGALEREGVVRAVGTTQKTRNAEIIEKYKAGATGEAIGDEYGITRERVFQILRPLNLPNLKAEQKRVARETIEAMREQIVAELQATRADDIARAVEIVRAGGSRAEAVRETQLPGYLIQKVCNDAGLPHLHGRWARQQEFDERKARIRTMRAEGKAWAEIGQSHYSWANRHMPELMGTRQNPVIKRSVDGVAPRTPRAVKPPKPDPESGWTPETVATLCRMYFDGCSSQQIADVLGEGFTRNSVIGKTNRLRAAKLLQPPTTGGAL